jgi:hypothetical protein
MAFRGYNSNIKLATEDNMDQQVALPSVLYKRLESYAKGFDSPTNVIERLLDFYEEYQNRLPAKDYEQPKESLPVKSYKLEVLFIPNGENVFKEALLERKLAWIKLFKTDGTFELKLWKAQDFSQKSDVMGNLRSGYLRGWKTKGIYKAVLAIEKSDIK